MNREEITKIMKEWLIGMVVASFNFSAGFILRFEREEPRSNHPNVIYLEFKSQAIFGSSENWSKFLRSLPLSPRRGEPDEPAIAYMIMMMLGAKISSVNLSEDGTLSIGTTDGDTLHLRGIEDVWDESWILSVKSELTETSDEEICCDSEGNISFS